MKQARFTYTRPYERGSLYVAHSGQLVDVLNLVAENTNGSRLWEIRANDGWEGYAFDFELEFIKEGEPQRVTKKEARQALIDLLDQFGDGDPIVVVGARDTLIQFISQSDAVTE